MKTPVLSRPSVCRSSSVRCAAALRYPATASAGVAAPPVHSARVPSGQRSAVSSSSSGCSGASTT